mmetsp:Transcript_52061/g.125675  ORF Transcript_52061/g.125675 Transcript_52061/m.125675 type:complete len:217 (-) Transcript_52061:2556-3206(-)
MLLDVHVRNGSHQRQGHNGTILMVENRVRLVVVRGQQQQRRTRIPLPPASLQKARWEKVRRERRKRSYVIHDLNHQGLNVVGRSRSHHMLQHMSRHLRHVACEQRQHQQVWTEGPTPASTRSLGRLDAGRLILHKQGILRNKNPSNGKKKWASAGLFLIDIQSLVIPVTTVHKTIQRKNVGNMLSQCVICYNHNDLFYDLSFNIPAAFLVLASRLL